MESEKSYKSENTIRLMTMLLKEPQYSFDDLKHIKIPVLVIAGERDIIKERHTRGIAKSIAGAELIIANNESHNFPTENPGRFNKYVLDFLRE